MLVGGSAKTITTESSTLSRYAILLGAQLAVGSAAIFARFALHGTGPICVSALRLAIAAFPLFIYSAFIKKISIAKKHEIYLALAGIALAIHFASWIGSLLYTSVAVSTLLVCTTPVWTALYDVFVSKHKKSLKFWLAFFGGAFGVILIATAHSNMAPIKGMELLGDVLAITGGMALAAYLIIIRSISDLYPTIAIVGRTYSWSALILFIATIFSHQPLPGNDAMSWGGIIAMAVVSQALGHTGINTSLRWFSSSIVAFSTLLEPVFAAVLAAIIFSESLSTQTIFGSVIVLFSLVIILKSSQTTTP